MSSDCKMWKPFVHSDTNFLIKVIHLDLRMKILLTDFKKLWVHENSQNDFIKSFKEKNPLFKGTEEEVFNEAVKVLNDVATISSMIFEENEKKCYLEVTGKFISLPLRVKCDFNLEGGEMFYEEVTVPLIKTVQFLELKKNKMGELLVAKDKELLEYNLQFGEISRKNIITQKYEKENDDKIDGILINVLTKVDTFYDNFGKQHGDILQIYPELKEKKIEKKKLTLPKVKKRKLS